MFSELDKNKSMRKRKSSNAIEFVHMISRLTEIKEQSESFADYKERAMLLLSPSVIGMTYNEFSLFIDCVGNESDRLGLGI